MGLVVVVQEPTHVTDPLVVQAAPVAPFTPEMVIVAVPVRDCVPTSFSCSASVEPEVPTAIEPVLMVMVALGCRS